MAGATAPRVVDVQQQLQENFRRLEFFCCKIASMLQLQRLQRLGALQRPVPQQAAGLEEARAKLVPLFNGAVHMTATVLGEPRSPAWLRVPGPACTAHMRATRAVLTLRPHPQTLHSALHAMQV